MIPDITVQRLRRLRAEGFSLRKISSTTGVSVNTIRSYLSQPGKGLVPKPTQFRKSRLDAIPRDDYESMYAACRGNYAALALAFSLFMKEKGNQDFSISRSAVRRYSLSRYPDLKQPAPDPAPFFVEPGQQLQIDFVECGFQFTGDAQPSKIKVFEAIYSYSRRAFILICPDLSQKSWLTGIVRCYPNGASLGKSCATTTPAWYDVAFIPARPNLTLVFVGFAIPSESIPKLVVH